MLSSKKKKEKTYIDRVEGYARMPCDYFSPALARKI